MKTEQIIEEREDSVKMKMRFKRFLSGFMAVATLASVIIQPVAVSASELEPEEIPFEQQYAELKDVQDSLDPDEIVKANDIELSYGQEFDVEVDLSGIEGVDESKIKILFHEAKNETGTDFDTHTPDTYKAVYAVKTVSGHPAYRISRNITVKEPETEVQLEHASLKNEGLEDVECVKVDDREFRDKVISHSKEVLASGDVRFTSELGRCETALNGMDRAEIEYEVLFHARAVLEEMGLENEVTLIGARVHGSRSRDDLYRADSDLDVVLSYRGNIREDSFFNELNSYGMAITGIKVDINPILEERITLAEYIKESEAYLDQQEIMKLAVDLDNFSYEYDTYEYKDTVGNREEQVEKLTEDILNKETAGLKEWLTEVSEESDIDSDVVTARSLLSRLENAETFSVFTRQPEQEQPEATITFYVAECMEFPVMGEYHENLTLEEALRIYETIPADRMNGIKGVGFELHDGSDYDGPYDLMRLGKVDREGVEMIQHYKESPLVQKAMDDVEKYFASKQEITKIEEKAVEDKSVPKENLPQPKSRKESVLQALRERQAKIKEQEQNTSKEKSKAHKKGDVTL